MKIIEEGILSKKYRTVVCPICECVFEPSKEDIKTHDYGMNEIRTNCQCPWCHKEVTIYEY